MPSEHYDERLTADPAVSVDVLGSPATAVNSVRCLRGRGRHFRSACCSAPSPHGRLLMDIVVARELEIYGSHGMSARAHSPMPAVVADRTLRPDLLLGEVIGLADPGAALAAPDRVLTRTGPLPALRSTARSSRVAQIEYGTGRGRTTATMRFRMRDPRHAAGRGRRRLRAHVVVVVVDAQMAVRIDDPRHENPACM
jgi:hypothetical protein